MTRFRVGWSVVDLDVHRANVLGPLGDDGGPELLFEHGRERVAGHRNGSKDGRAAGPVARGPGRGHRDGKWPNSQIALSPGVANPTCLGDGGQEH